MVLRCAAPWELLTDAQNQIGIRSILRAAGTGTRCQGLTFVVTGDVHIYKNRNELKTYIESQGGKVTGSVSRSTSFLINNDVTSTSGKNKKAQELGIDILSEEEFVKRYAK